jgi:hypothetical protein
MSSELETEAEFTVEQADEETILVRHTAESHRYAYFIVAEGGHRILGDGITINNQAIANEGTIYNAQARAFAEKEARERKLID